jgi:peptidoglycan/LPS O-acetylase OafA/YrhL
LIPGRLDQFLVGMLAARFYLRWKHDARTSGVVENRRLSDLLSRILDRFPRLACGISLVLLFAWTYGLNQVGGAPVHAPWKLIAPTCEALVCVAVLLGYVAAVQHVPRLLARLLSFLGNMSFSIYVCHFMVVGLLIGDITHVDRLPGHSIDFIGRFGVGVHANAALNTFLLSFPAVLALSYLFFHAVELPFMRLRGRYVIEPEADQSGR